MHQPSRTPPLLLSTLPLFLLLGGCQSNAIDEDARPAAGRSSAGGCDAVCHEGLMRQYEEAAADCRAGSQGACARKARLSARMNSL